MALNLRTAYEILCIPLDADAAVIRKAYRTLAKKLHPDHAGNSPEAENAFIELKAAYEILSNPIRKRMYDHDPGGVLVTQVYSERRRAHLKRRRKRLMRLYE